MKLIFRQEIGSGPPGVPPNIEVALVADCGREFPAVARILDADCLNPVLLLLYPLGLRAVALLPVLWLGYRAEWSRLAAGEVVRIEVESREGGEPAVVVIEKHFAASKN